MRDYGRIQSNIDQTSTQKNRLNGFVTFLVGLILFSLCLLLVVNFFGYHSTKVTLTTYKMIKDQIKTTGLLLRDEIVTFAQQSGEVKIAVAEGEKVSTGNHIATIINNKKKDKLYNYHSGIVSYKIDGLEMTLREESRKDLTYSQFIKLKGKINSVSSGDNINVGRPVFKIIDNFNFYLAVLLPQKKLDNYEVGSNVEVIFSKIKGEYFKGKIDMILSDKPDNVMIIKFDKFLPQLINLRKTEVEVIRRRYEGIVVPTSALIQKDDKTGVIVSGYTKKYFKEIKVVGKVGNQAVIKGIGPGVKVILN